MIFITFKYNLNSIQLQGIMYRMYDSDRDASIPVNYIIQCIKVQPCRVYLKYIGICGTETLMKSLPN